MLLRFQGSKWRGERACDCDFRKCTLQVLGQLNGDSRFSPVQKVPKAFVDRPTTDLEHQIWTVDTFHFAMSLKMSNPDCWHSVWRYNEGAIQNLPKLWVALCLHHAMHARNAYIALLSLANGCFNEGSRDIKVKSMHSHA